MRRQQQRAARRSASGSAIAADPVYLRQDKTSYRPEHYVEDQVMNQPDLFDFGGYEPRRARDTDPQTSQQVVIEFVSKAAAHKTAMLMAIRAKPKTAREAARECVTAYGGDFESYRKRSGELKAAGLVYVVQTRRCADSGCSAEGLATRW